ncbi:hypothetical protein F53441_13396 [Fusarium austroafricanum]|uniref:Extracellular membrane protein CFEM domain-containing protein n=1 Tax=Fusarium austroafricanum TaxID=2364996 RepID=A0A8H4NJZ9_9HYPO|nr:hypothetical protein F53441_13396 [Fusarium austroafricanum]
MIFTNFAAGLVAALSINGVYAGPCRPTTQTTAIASSETTAATSSDTTTAETTAAVSSDTTTAETSFATSTVLTTSGLDFTTDLTTFITLTADTTTSELATTSAWVPADLFPCTDVSECVANVRVCDPGRCGCLNGFCRVLTDTTTAATATSAAVDETTTTAAADETTTTEAVNETTTTADATITSAAVNEFACSTNEECDQYTIEGYDCMLSTCVCEGTTCRVSIIITD